MSDNEKEKLQKLMIAGDLQPAIAFLEEMMAIDPTIINTGLNMNGVKRLSIYSYMHSFFLVC